MFALQFGGETTQGRLDGCSKQTESHTRRTSAQSPALSNLSCCMEFAFSDVEVTPSHVVTQLIFSFFSNFL